MRSHGDRAGRLANDPTLDPIVLTPVPVPILPATDAIKSRFGKPAQEHAARLDLPGEPAARRFRSADPLRLPSFDELLDDLFRASQAGPIDLLVRSRKVQPVPSRR